MLQSFRHSIPCSEVPEKRGLLQKPNRLQTLTLPERFFHHFHDIVHMTLRVDPTENSFRG